MTYRILITGSRTWDDITYIRSVFGEMDRMLSNKVQAITLVSGACPTGADRLGEIVAAEMGWKVERHPADWKTYGKRAGFVRNSQMVDTSPDAVVAFVRNKSKGASMTVNLSKNKGIFTVIHEWMDYPFTSYNVKYLNKIEDNDNLPFEDTLF